MKLFKEMVKNRLWLILAITFAGFIFSHTEYEGGLLSLDSSWASEEAAHAPEGGDAAAAPEGEVEEEESPYKPAPKLTEKDYPQYSFVNGRIMIWIVAQLHLFFAAFVLGVPIFVLIIELIGHLGGDKRYDNMAHEFIKVAMTAFSLTASLGGLLGFCLIIFYPDFFGYMAGIFGDAMLIYALLFFGESFFLYVYYYGWDITNDGGNMKWVHLTCGLMLNVCGMTLMVLSNAWATFMMAPSGVDETGVFQGQTWAAIQGFLWNPVNLHRFIANIAYGGSIVGAYAAYKFISAKAEEERAHYDWMGYTANIICVIGLLPLPFAGYWLMKEVYTYSQQMGITLMGGVFAWLFIIQAVLIGAIFLSCNYYLWCGMGRSEGAKRYTPAIKYIATLLIFCFLMWLTPHTLVMTSKEVASVGGTHHPVLGYLGVMSAKNTAVNIMILLTFLSFQLYRRSNIEATVEWARQGNGAMVALYMMGVANIIWLGIYGYLIPASVRIGLSVPQVCTTLSVIVICSIIEAFMFKDAREVGEVKWGKMPVRSQYALFILAVSFTWLMGLMGYVRSAVRQHWHVYTVFRDYSADAFTTSLGYAGSIITITTLIFMALVVFVFWLASFAGKKAGAH